MAKDESSWISMAKAVTGLIKESLFPQIRNACAMNKDKIDTWEIRLPDKIIGWVGSSSTRHFGIHAFILYPSQFGGEWHSQTHRCRHWSTEGLRPVPMVKWLRHGIPECILGWILNCIPYLPMSHEISINFDFLFADLWRFSTFLKLPLWVTDWSV